MNYNFSDHVNVLGTRYSIVTGKAANKILEQNQYGSCEFSEHTIYIRDFDTQLREFDEDEKNGKHAKNDYNYPFLWFAKKTLKHEIVHAFIFESGLHNNARILPKSSWAKNEEIIDWIALQGEKIYKAWKEAGAIDSEE